MLPTVMVVNAAHFKPVPGRKTDVKDAAGIADLLRHGLLRASFIPDRAQRERRELTRYRTSLVRARAAAVNRVQQVLEGAHSKLAAVATDSTGVSAREMLAALLAGRTDTAAIAQCARGAMREKIPQLERAPEGTVGPHQRFLLAAQLAPIDYLDAPLERVSAEVAARVPPFEAEVALVGTATGLGRRTAEAVVAEVGVHMGRLPDADHLTSWAGLAPGSNESAGKRKRGKTRKGSPWLRATLIEAAQAAGRSKDTYLGTLYHRLVGRIGEKRAAVAVARKLLVIIYHILTTHQPYRELGADYRARQNQQAVERRAVRQRESLGNNVTLQPKAPAA